MPSHSVQNVGAYQYAELARNFVKVGQRSPVGKGKVVIVIVSAKKGIGNEFYERSFPDTSASDKKDSVWRVCLVLCHVGDGIPTRLNVAGSGQTRTGASTVLSGLPGSRRVMGPKSEPLSKEPGSNRPADGSFTKRAPQRCIRRVNGGDCGTKSPN